MSGRRPTARELQGDPRPPPLDLEFDGGDAIPEVRLDAEAFDDLVLARGVGCSYRRAVRCPCARIETGGARSGCPSCRGLGLAYPAGMEAPIVAIITGRSPRRSRLAGGEMVTGTCTVTFPSGIVPAQGDMLLPDGEVHSVTEILRRQMAQVDPVVVRGRATAPDQLAPLVRATTERLRYPGVVTVEAVAWIDNGALRLGRAGVDFTVDGNAIQFVGDAGPAAGGAFSVRYLAPGAYVIAPAEPVARTGEPGFPYRAEAQRLDQLGSPDLG